MVEYPGIEMTTDQSGNQAVTIPLTDWKNIQQDMKELEEYRAMKSGLKSALLEVEAIKSGELEKKTLKNFLAELPDIHEAIVEIEEHTDYERILSEQNYKPVTYEQFRALADDIEWEHSLDEMLAALD